MFLLAQALKTLPVGTAYAVWTGIGAAGTAIIGMGGPEAGFARDADSGDYRIARYEQSLACNTG
jgi:hypothetical protein